MIGRHGLILVSICALMYLMICVVYICKLQEILFVWCLLNHIYCELSSLMIFRKSDWIFDSSKTNKIILQYNVQVLLHSPPVKLNICNFFITLNSYISQVNQPKFTKFRIIKNICEEKHLQPWFKTALEIQTKTCSFLCSVLSWYY